MRKYLILLLVMPLFFTACNDSDDKVQETRFIVNLTDSPDDYEEVLIDLQELWVNVSDGEEGWTQLPLEVTGQIDLLELANGKDTVLVDENFPSGQIQQMRMVLGNNNEIKVEGEYHELKTPSAQQSGLKFNIHASLEPGIDYEMWLDFQVDKSIVEKGNGTYSLKPTIRVFTAAITGAIKGKVEPLEAKPTVYAIDAANDTVSTFADELTGEFLIRGLEAGSYKLEFEPIEGYFEKEMMDVQVSIENVTDVGVVQIEMEPTPES